jgi:D-alanine--poly(phosphoribitol) ligase subunit 2
MTRHNEDQSSSITLEGLPAEPSRAAEADLPKEITNILVEILNVPAPAPSADLFATGILDSLGLVRLLADLEERFQMLVPVQELDLEAFRTVNNIARLLSDHREEWKNSGAQSTVERTLSTR